MFWCFVISAAIQCSHGALVEDLDWATFKTRFAKTYASDQEEMTRYNHWKVRVDRVKSHNAKNLPWTMDGNHEYGDWSPEEIAAKRACSELEGFQPNGVRLADRRYHEISPEVNLSTAVDWDSWGAVSPIKNQGGCELCWIFAATGALEGALAIARDKVRNNGQSQVRSFSEQQFLNCMPGNKCSQGGFSVNAWKYLIANTDQELCTEDEYLYTGKDGSCNVPAGGCSGGLDQHEVISYTSVDNNDATLMSAIAQQPVKVTIDAYALQDYGSGVLDAPCGSHSGAKQWHAVLLVGYGTDPSQGDYWKLKNSWGNNAPGHGWHGEGGFFRIKRDASNGGNLCMYSDGQPNYPVLRADTFCDDGYSQDWNFGCQSAFRCNNPDGSHKEKCDVCGKVADGKCHVGNTMQCPAGFSKSWNFPCQSACGCNNPDGSHKAQCDKCCKVDDQCHWLNAIDVGPRLTEDQRVSPALHLALV